MRPTQYSQPRLPPVELAVIATAVVRPSLCCATALGQLGPVLCVYPFADSHPLCGWERACAAVHRVSIKSDDGPQEAVVFLDSRGAICWRLGLLPDTDYLQWDRFVEPLAHSGGAQSVNRFPLWSRCGRAGAIGEPVWQACPLRLHTIEDDAHSVRLAASCTALSPLGRQACARWFSAERAR